MPRKQHRICQIKWICTWRNKNREKKIRPGTGGGYRRNPAGRKKFLPWILLAPSLLGVGIFTLIPFLDVFRRSFQKAVGTGFVGLENYRTVLDNQLSGWRREHRQIPSDLSSTAFRPFPFLCPSP